MTQRALPIGARHLKAATRRAEIDGGADVTATVRRLLEHVANGGEAEIIRLSQELDGGPADPVVSPEAMAAAAATLPASLAEDIRFAHDNIRRFALMQRETLIDCEMEIVPGLVAGQRQIPVATAGCYVPGGRYAHIASALMTVTTAKAAGVPHVVACSPPRGGAVAPEILFALHLAGADTVLALGGVQAIGAMVEGAFGAPPADIIVGPGNALVAEAKRLLFGRVGIDMIAGPTDSLVIADASADAATVAADLVGQAEHGATSPVWLVTDDEAIARQVLAIAPQLIEALPHTNREAAAAAWEACAEVILCPDRETMAATADAIAPEHLHVQAADLDWWLARLTTYGSLFLGAETTVPFGDKASGPNHVLPTAGAARYTGGLSVQKFLRTVTWQRADAAAASLVGAVAARISRAEGMEAHARSADLRVSRDET